MRTTQCMAVSSMPRALRVGVAHSSLHVMSTHSYALLNSRHVGMVEEREAGIGSVRSIRSRLRHSCSAYIAHDDHSISSASRVLDYQTILPLPSHLVCTT